jgi:hypothetical protein
MERSQVLELLVFGAAKIFLGFCGKFGILVSELK